MSDTTAPAAPCTAPPDQPDAIAADTQFTDQIKDLARRIHTEASNDLTLRAQLTAEQSRLVHQRAALRGAASPQVEPLTPADAALEDQPPPADGRYFAAPDWEAQVLRAAGMDARVDAPEAAEARATLAEGWKLAAALGARPSELRGAVGEIARDLENERRLPGGAAAVQREQAERFQKVFGDQAAAVHARVGKLIAQTPGLRDWLEDTGAGNSTHVARALDRIAQQRGIR